MLEMNTEMEPRSAAWLPLLPGVSECRGLCTCMWGCGACAVRR